MTNLNTIQKDTTELLSDEQQIVFDLINLQLQQLLIKPATRRVAGRSPAIDFIFLFVAGLKANCCRTGTHSFS